MRLKTTAFNSFQLREGLSIAYQEWGAGNLKRVLALHGFLDNSNSFSILGPRLANEGYHVVAIDHIGHGYSSHIAANTTYQFPQYIGHVKNVLDKLQWDKSYIVGHSMGAIMSGIFSATFPERVNKLVLLEGLVPFTAAPNDTVRNLRRALEAEEKARLSGLFSRTPKEYSSLGVAIDVRVKAATLFPGGTYITFEGAKAIVQRGAMACDGTSLMGESDLGRGPVSFLHDARHHLPTYTRMTKEQALNFTDSISAPTQLISGDEGLAYPSADMKAHTEILHKKDLLKHITLPGSHHLHVDPKTAPKVAEVVVDFLNRA